MTFADLALISAVALLGPLLAGPERGHLPVLLGELVAGMLIGRTGFGLVHPDDATFTFLADIGFALVMFVAGTRVPIRDRRLRGAARAGTLRIAGVALLAVPVGLLISRLFGTGHAPLYVVLLASSSAALVLPIVEQLGLAGPSVLALLFQVAVADTLCIVALPLVIDPSRAARAALGAVAVIAATVVLFLALRHVERSGLRRRLHRRSEQRKFALELRISLMIVFALAALAVAGHVSILLAGFCSGLAVTAVGEPRRLAKQLFALTDGFFGPVFFVWLGASLDVRRLGSHPRYALLGLALGAGAVAIHMAMRAAGQPLALGGLAAAQLGVPVAAATVGVQSGLLAAGEASALVLGALVTIAVATVAGTRAARTVRPPA